jgi:hypothetical protein
MSIQKKLRVLCLKTLGCKAEPWDNVWDDVKELVEAFGERRVVEAFEEWAEVKKGELIARPIGDFSRVAAGICTGTVQLKPKGDLFALLNDLAAIGGNQVLFNREQQAAIGRLMATHSPADIKSAFSEFWGNISGDDFLVRQAAKTFTEAAEQLLFVRAKRVEDARKTSELIRVSTENEVAKARNEIEKAIRRAEEVEFLIEDSLPDELGTLQ